MEIVLHLSSPPTAHIAKHFSRSYRLLDDTWNACGAHIPVAQVASTDVYLFWVVVLEEKKTRGRKKWPSHIFDRRRPPHSIFLGYHQPLIQHRYLESVAHLAFAISLFIGSLFFKIMKGCFSCWTGLLVLSASFQQHVTLVVVAFSIDRHHRHHPPTRRRRQQHSTLVVSAAAAAAGASDNPKELLFQMEGWAAIQSDLDRVPIFTVATPQGNPLAYQVEINNNTDDITPYTVPFFYCDIGDALRELEGAKNNTSMIDLDIIPFPLGKAFQLWCQDEAVIVPSKEAVLQAGAPPGTNPVGQQVPMFACLEIMEENEDGTGVLPLFMSLEDANAAVKEAVKEDGGKEGDLQVVCLSLSGAVEQLATIPESPGFHFIPPSSSMKYISEYLS
jgi:hypothetical protein